MTDSKTNCRLLRSRVPFVLAALAMTTFRAHGARAADDVLLQIMDSKIVLGGVDDQTFSGTLGMRVHSGAFNSSFLTADPGFLSFAHGNFNMPSGAGGFPALHNVNFDLLPMTVGQTAANLLYWNGADTGANGLTVDDVAFAPSVGVNWQVLDGTSTWITVNGDDSFVPGGLIQRTSDDINPNDGVDSGAMHKHVAMRVVDGGLGSPPPQGVYMVAWQIRSGGFESSDPLVMLHRTSGAPAAALTAAVAWADANYDALTTPPLPGDFDLSGQVDGNDFLTWQRNLGTPAATDLAVWRDAMTSGTAVIAATAVPEPATPLLATFGALAALAVRRRRVITFHRISNA
jgi:hypothetical protein